MKVMKTVLTFIGGVAVGILAVTGIYALEDDTSTESIDDNTDCDEEIEFEDDESKISDDDENNSDKIS
ncbi:MAG: hypothetical protein KKE62_15975 [Proteobacteria bacterium]|nr:hypothetical protein [Pseudomonadota bacterium]MBU1387882.1 hypothetical protein [Pseudomonadota bacterium]MBU1544328.1 hypothetical protein [Pseudomonadota bacterium]MBU2482667.1 hypothetical protein [Pseudomonadota bacterium]